MKVRIGNDIRLNLTLKGPKSYDEKNIKELHCYLVNTSVTKCFGKDPHCHCHPHDHVCGCPSYHVEPHCLWHTRHIPCAPHLKYPFSPCDPAMGQGPLPPKYRPNCCCDEPTYCRYGHMDPRSNCFGCFHDHNCKPDMDHLCHHNCWDGKVFNNHYVRPGFFDTVSPHFDEDFRYLAPSRVMADKNRIQTYFPAADQFMCGNYKLVVVLVVYEAGWGRCDLHTYTIDYGTVVTLVDDDSAIDGAITIDVDNDQLEDSNITNIEVSGEYTMLPGNELRIGDKDYNGKEYKLIMTLANGGSAPFDPTDWDYGTVKFYSDDPSIVRVDENTGRLYAMQSGADKQTTINVYSGTVRASYTVKVIGSGMDYIVFANTTDVNKVNAIIKDRQTISGAKVYSYDNIFGTHDLINPTDGNYLWICTRRPIADSNSTMSHVKCSMFDVPLLPVQMRPADNLYYYMCPNSLIETGTFDITVEP